MNYQINHIFDTYEQANYFFEKVNPYILFEKSDIEPIFIGSISKGKIFEMMFNLWTDIKQTGKTYLIWVFGTTNFIRITDNLKLRQFITDLSDNEVFMFDRILRKNVYIRG